MENFCPNCQRNTQQTFKQRKDEIVVRGESIPVVREIFYCKSCGEEYENPAADADPMVQAQRVYRERKGMLQPRELIGFRKSLGLTQKEWSGLLGIGNATLIRYENGALQSDAHDRMIRLCMQPKNLLKCLNEIKQAYAPERLAQLIMKLEQMDQDGPDLLAAAVKQFASYSADIFSGQKSFDVEKLFEVMKYFCFKDHIPRTKLIKLLFYADFSHFKDHRVSITGMRYARGDHGPLPEKFATWLSVLCEWRKEIQVQEQDNGDFVGEVYFTTAYDWTGFSAAELATLATVKDKFQELSAKQFREVALKEAALQLTHSGEWISYALAKDVRV
jgi:putative zinc finger/helix-turn-helix YgiT family protein